MLNRAQKPQTLRARKTPRTPNKKPKDEKEEPYLVPGRRFAEEVQIDCYKHLLPVVSEVKTPECIRLVFLGFQIPEAFVVLIGFG